MGLLLGFLLFGVVVSSLVLVLGGLLLNVPINGTLIDLYAAALLFIAATLSLGLLVSTFAQTQMQAFQMAFFLMLPSILLSGFMFPFEGMPAAAQWLAQLLPLTHFIDLIRGIVLRGAVLSELQPPIYKLLVFIAAMLAIVRLRFRKRLD
jgi:ABC-2 type transport system permease protein